MRSSLRDSLRAYVHDRAAELRAGVSTARAARLDPPAPGSGRLQRVGYGLGLPLAILRVVWSSAPARRVYGRVIGYQLAAVLGITVLVAWSSHHDGDHKPRVRLRVDDHGVRVGPPTDGHEPPDGREESGGHEEAKDEADAPDAPLAPSLPALPEPPARHSAPPAAAGPTGPVGRARAWLEARLGPTLAFWSELYATLGVVEWIVIALSREYHESLSKMAAELTFVPPEGTRERPSTRVNVRWMIKQLKRRIRGLLLLVAGAIVLWPTLLLPHGSLAMKIVQGAWGLYWLLVFTVGKTEHAWAAASPPAPWFIRWAERAASHRVLRFAVCTWGTRLLRRTSAELFSPAAHLEQAPYEVAGLALARGITRLPGLYLLVRPIIPVAATHVVVGPGRLPPGA